MSRWVYEKDIYPNDDQTRSKKMKQLAEPPRVGRKSKREENDDDGDEADAGKKKTKSNDREKPDGDDDESKRGRGGSKWMDAVAPEVKSDLSREEKKMRAELQRFQKLETRTKMTAAPAGSSSCAEGGGAEAGKEVHVPYVASEVTTVGKKVNSPSRSPANAAPASACISGGTFRSLAQAISMRQGAAGSAGAPAQWPTSPYTWRPGVNDSWNLYQVSALLLRLARPLVILGLEIASDSLCTHKTLNARPCLWFTPAAVHAGGQRSVYLRADADRMSSAFPLQAANRGKQATVAEWKAARQALHDARESLLDQAGPKERERLLATFGIGASGQGSRDAKSEERERAPSNALSAALIRKPDKLDVVSSAPLVSM